MWKNVYGHFNLCQDEKLNAVIAQPSILDEGRTSSIKIYMEVVRPLDFRIIVQNHVHHEC